MVALSHPLRSLLLAEAERARTAADADCAAISRWERDTDVMRTLVNVGRAAARRRACPGGRDYRSTPSRPWPRCCARAGRTSTPTTSRRSPSPRTTATTRTRRCRSSVDGERWAELWVSRKKPDAQMLGPGDLDCLHLVAERLGDALAPHV